MEIIERVTRLETTQAQHGGQLADHESRIRDVEKFKAQALAYGAMGSAVGGSLVAIAIKVLL
jgi:hypothetical protein